MFLLFLAGVGWGSRYVVVFVFAQDHQGLFWWQLGHQKTILGANLDFRIAPDLLPGLTSVLLPTLHVPCNCRPIDFRIAPGCSRVLPGSDMCFVFKILAGKHVFMVSETLCFSSCGRGVWAGRRGARRASIHPPPIRPLLRCHFG